jgi:hypothetical protein
MQDQSWTGLAKGVNRRPGAIVSLPDEPAAAEHKPISGGPNATGLI